MATATTPEHIEAQPAPVAEKAPRVEVRKIAIDNSTLSVLAVGVALFALAFGAFTQLSGRIDSLDAKIEKQAARNDARIEKLDAKIEQQAARTDARIDRLDAKIEKVSSELNAKIDRVDAKIDAGIDKLDAKIDAVNARLDRLFEVIASQGRRES